MRNQVESIAGCTDVPFGFELGLWYARRPPSHIIDRVMGNLGKPGRSRQVRWVPLAFVSVSMRSQKALSEHSPRRLMVVEVPFVFVSRFGF